MKNRRAIVFFLFWNVVFASAIALLTVSDRSRGEPSGGSLLAVDVREVVKVDIERRAGAGGVRENLSIVRRDGRWRIEQPVKAEADEEAVKRLIDSVVFAERGESNRTKLIRVSHFFTGNLSLLFGCKGIYLQYGQAFLRTTVNG